MDTPSKSYKEQWIEALRSGKYKQGSGLLSRFDGSYCCLGVLCEVMQIPKVASTGVSGFIYGEDVAFFPYQYLEQSGLNDAHGSSKTDGLSLVRMNDAGYSFEKIADAIEKGDYIGD